MQRLFIAPIPGWICCLLLFPLACLHAQNVDTALVNRLRAEAGGAFQRGEFEKNVILTDSLAQAYAIFSMYNGWTHLNELKDFNRAEFYALQALQTVEEKLGGRLPYLNDLYGLFSSIYGKTGNSEKSLEYGHRAVQAGRDLDKAGTFGDFVAHNNLGIIYLEIKRWAEALPYLLKARELILELARENGWDFRLHINASKLQAQLSLCYLGLNEPALALQEATAGLSYPEAAGQPDHFDFHEIYLSLAEAYLHQGRPQKALYYYQKLEGIYTTYFGFQSIQMARLCQKKPNTTSGSNLSMKHSAKIRLPCGCSEAPCWKTLFLSILRKQISFARDANRPFTNNGPAFFLPWRHACLPGKFI